MKVKKLIGLITILGIVFSGCTNSSKYNNHQQQSYSNKNISIKKGRGKPQYITLNNKNRVISIKNSYSTPRKNEEVILMYEDSFYPSYTIPKKTVVCKYKYKKPSICNSRFSETKSDVKSGIVKGFLAITTLGLSLLAPSGRSVNFNSKFNRGKFITAINSSGLEEKRQIYKNKLAKLRRERRSRYRKSNSGGGLMGFLDRNANILAPLAVAAGAYAVGKAVVNSSSSNYSSSSSSSKSTSKNTKKNSKNTSTDNTSSSSYSNSCIVFLKRSDGGEATSVKVRAVTKGTLGGFINPIYTNSHGKAVLKWNSSRAVYRISADGHTLSEDLNCKNGAIVSFTVR